MVQEPRRPSVDERLTGQLGELMFDPITLGVGSVLVVAGWAVGRSSRRRSTASASTPQPRCSCGHGLEQHDPDTRQCHDSTLRKNVRTSFGYRIGDQWVDCACRQYLGPQPLEEVFIRPLLPPIE
jgi:hypothetical protein